MNKIILIYFFLFINQITCILGQKIEVEKAKYSNINKAIKIEYSNYNYEITDYIILANKILIYSEEAHLFKLIDKKNHTEINSFDITTIKNLHIYKYKKTYLNGNSINVKSPFNPTPLFKLYKENDTTIIAGLVLYKNNGNIIKQYNIMKICIYKDSIFPQFTPIDIKQNLNKDIKISNFHFENGLDAFFPLNNGHILSFSLYSPYFLKKQKKPTKQNLLLYKQNQNYDTLFQIPNETPLLNGNTFINTNEEFWFTVGYKDTIIVWNNNLKILYKGKFFNKIELNKNLKSDDILYHTFVNNNNNKIYHILIEIKNNTSTKKKQFTYFFFNTCLKDKKLKYEYFFCIKSETELVFNNETDIDNKLYFLSRADVYSNSQSYNLYSLNINNIKHDTTIYLSYLIHNNLQKNTNTENLSKDELYIILKHIDKIKIFNDVVINATEYPQNSVNNLVYSIKKVIKTNNWGYFFSYLTVYNKDEYTYSVNNLLNSDNYIFLENNLNILIAEYNDKYLSQNKNKASIVINQVEYSFIKINDNWYLLPHFKVIKQ